LTETLRLTRVGRQSLTELPRAFTHWQQGSNDVTQIHENSA